MTYLFKMFLVIYFIFVLFISNTQQDLIPTIISSSNDGSDGSLFGCSVSISDNVLLVGAYAMKNPQFASGLAFIFERNNGIWIQKQTLFSSDGSDGDSFGYSVGISGNISVIGSPQSTIFKDKFGEQTKQGSA